MGRIVYSTQHGSLCSSCQQTPCQCHLQANTVTGDGHVRISYTTKGRKGKGATLITGIPLNAAELKKLHKELKQKTSAGGTIKESVLELQGDQRQKLLTLLQHRGYLSVKLSGG